jgi:hypothetical protein
MRLKASEGGHGKVRYIRMNPRKALSEFLSQEVVLSDVHGSADDSLLCTPVHSVVSNVTTRVVA